MVTMPANIESTHPNLRALKIMMTDGDAWTLMRWKVDKTLEMSFKKVVSVSLSS